MILAAKTDEQLLEHAAFLQAEADRLLHQEGLLALLQLYGPACVIGSYALDLMTWPDIDLNVQLSNELDASAFFEVGHCIIKGFRVVKMTFSNQFIRTDVPFDRGLYWGIRLQYGERIWKLDLWGYGEEDYQASWEKFEELRAALVGVDRIAILRIKDVMCREEHYRVEVSSMQIYEAVSQGGVKTVAGFREWLARW